jgi:hypothetical protein
VTHTCNPSYLGGRDQVDQGFKPDWAKPFTKIGLVEWLKVKTLNSNPTKKIKQNKKNLYLCNNQLIIVCSSATVCF